MTGRPASHRGTPNSTLVDVLNQTPTYRCLWKARREVFSGTSSNGDLEGYVDGVSGSREASEKEEKTNGYSRPSWSLCHGSLHGCMTIDSNACSIVSSFRLSAAQYTASPSSSFSPTDEHSPGSSMFKQQ